VEGNTTDSVGRRSYALNDSNIWGYGRPKWGTQDGGSEEPKQDETQKPEENPNKNPKVSYAVQLPLLKKGDKGEYVKTLQVLLLAHGCDLGTWGADGDFGRQTQLAVCFFQSSMGLSVDGEVGGDTWNAILSKW
jgi:peptidoglycan hydrolase-like protein with peptidoglycan-binding domain